MNIQLADSLMDIFGYKRSSPTDEELAMMEDAHETKQELNRESNPLPAAHFNVGDDVYVNHAWRKVRNVTWCDDHYEYELNPWDHHDNTEEELDEHN